MNNDFIEKASDILRDIEERDRTRREARREMAQSRQELAVVEARLQTMISDLNLPVFIHREATAKMAELQQTLEKLNRTERMIDSNERLDNESRQRITRLTGCVVA